MLERDALFFCAGAATAATVWTAVILLVEWRARRWMTHQLERMRRTRDYAACGWLTDRSRRPWYLIGRAGW